MSYGNRFLLRSICSSLRIVLECRQLLHHTLDHLKLCIGIKALKWWNLYSASIKLSKLTCVLRETDCQRTLANLLFEQIFFVQEQDDGCVREPFIIANGIEQFQRFLHTILFFFCEWTKWESELVDAVGGRDNISRQTYRGLVLVQYLIVFGHGYAEDDCCDIFETMNPLLSFGSLTADIE